MLGNAFDFIHSYHVGERCHSSQRIFKLNQVFNAVEKILSAGIKVTAIIAVKPTIAATVKARVTSIAPFEIASNFAPQSFYQRSLLAFKGASVC